MTDKEFKIIKILNYIFALILPLLLLFVSKTFTLFIFRKFNLGSEYIGHLSSILENVYIVFHTLSISIMCAVYAYSAVKLKFSSYYKIIIPAIIYVFVLNIFTVYDMFIKRFSIPNYFILDLKNIVMSILEFIVLPLFIFGVSKLLKNKKEKSKILISAFWGVVFVNFMNLFSIFSIYSIYPNLNFDITQSIYNVLYLIVNSAIGIGIAAITVKVLNKKLSDRKELIT